MKNKAALSGHSNKKLYKKTILVMGSGRSGSTWLAGLMASPFRYRLLFEPFHPEHVPGANLAADRYYDPESVPTEVINFIHRALDDRINSKWIAQSSNRRFGMHRWRWWPKVRVVKIIRGNLMIPTINRLYGESVPIIILVRHPGAVVESMLRVKFSWAFDLSILLNQGDFFKEYDLPQKLLAEQATDPVSQMTVRWLVENLYLFQNADKLGIKLVFYEDLIQNPVEQISRLCAEVGVDPYSDLAEKVSKPSYTTHPRSPVKKGTITAQAWRTRLPQADIEKIEAIMQSVNFTYPR